MQILRNPASHEHSPMHHHEILRGLLELAGRSEADIRTAVGAFTKEQIGLSLAADPFMKNLVLNCWEAVNFCDVLDSYPFNISLPIADLCNARCTFCTSWLGGRAVLTPEQLVQRYAEVLPYARYVGLQGHGEPLANPHIAELLKIIREMTDQRMASYIITNGVFLKRHIEPLIAARVTTYNISLNAASAAAHDTVMGLGPNTFYEIIEVIKYLIALRDTVNPQTQVNISFVLTADNVQELPQFIELGNVLNVNNIYIRTLMPIQHQPPGLNYTRLVPFLHPEYVAIEACAREAMARSKVNIIAQPDT